ncbi:MAG TPA: TonB family protein [Steroidobacteraceae bacterium]|nr:TonB family protein [Steroidobacteraceae bacterium]
MRNCIVLILCFGGLGGCAHLGLPVPASPTLLSVAELEDSTISFMVAGPRFTPGESAMVKVCLSAEGEIVSTQLIASSGERKFDDSALVWALQAKMSPLISKGKPVATCEQVRVEIRGVPYRQIGAGSDFSLG